MRVSKRHDVRLNEILDAAELMFTQTGYEKATVNNVLDKVQIGKGTLYYYFESKEEMADGVIERAIKDITATAKAAADAPASGAHEKMMKVISSLNIADSPHFPLFGALGNPANALLHQKVTLGMIRELAPILASVVKQGAEEGIYHTDYPLETMEIVLAANQTLYNWTIMQFEPEERAPRMAAFLRMIELSLGAKEGSFNFMYAAYEPPEVKQNPDGLLK